MDNLNPNFGAIGGNAQSAPLAAERDQLVVAATLQHRQTKPCARMPHQRKASSVALLLQLLATQWGPATRVFGTIGMALADWAIAAGVASSVLLLEEARKLGLRACRGNAQPPTSPTPPSPSAR